MKRLLIGLLLAVTAGCSPAPEETMDKRPAVTYGVTPQYLEFYPPEWAEGIPAAAASFSVRRGGQSDDDTAEFSGTASMDTLSLQVTGASGYGQANRKRLLMSTTTGLTVDRVYRAENQYGQRELTRLAAVSAGVYADAHDDLAYDYPNSASSLIKGFRQLVTLDATWLQTESKMNDPAEPHRCILAYTINGIPRRHVIQFDLVRHARQVGITEADLIERHPWLTYKEHRDRRGGGWLRAKIADGLSRVDADLTMAKRHPSELAEGELLTRIDYEAIMMVIAEDGACPPGRDAGEYTRERAAIYKRDIEKALAGDAFVVSDGREGSVNTEPTRPGWFVS